MKNALDFEIEVYRENVPGLHVINFDERLAQGLWRRT